MSGVSTVLPECKSVLVFAPHPDDEIFGCGATLVLLREAGARVSIHIVTDGAQGGSAHGSRLCEIRARESEAALQCLGLPHPFFWQMPDRSLSYGERLVERIRQTVKDENPDLVFLPSPTEVHPDHQALGLAGLEALRRFDGAARAVFYEISAPLPQPNLLLDISTKEECKKRAMECYVSQLSEQPYAEQIAGLNTFRAFSLGAKVSSAEAFFLADGKDNLETVRVLTGGVGFYRHLHGYAAATDDLPLVSIIVRSMDRPTLDETLGSLAIQTYSNIEVVVVNAKGGQHNGVGTACGRFPLRILNDGGPSLARSRAANVGLAECQGGLIGFLDDDDLIDPNHIDRLVGASLASGELKVVYSDVRGMRRGDGDGRAVMVFNSPRVDFPTLLLGNVVPIHAILFPSAFLQCGVAFDEALDCYEDWDFWMQLLRLAPFQHVEGVTATYFMGGDSSVSPLDPDQQKVQEAKSKLYAKWADLLTPEDLQLVSNLYHQSRENLTGRAAGLESRLQEMESRLNVSEAVRMEQKTHLEEQTTHLEEVLNSTSWRLTRPLRWAGSRLRHFFKSEEGESVGWKSGLHELLKKGLYRSPLPEGRKAELRAWYHRHKGGGRFLKGSLPKPDPMSRHTLQALNSAPRHLLLIERSVLRPNQDAGSVMIFNFVRVLRNLGYAVTFFPVDLIYDQSYTPALQRLVVQCLHAPVVQSLAEHLADAGSRYDYVLTCRPDQTDNLLPFIKKYAPQAAVIYETHDLHFVREERQAEIEKDDALKRHAVWRKKQELRIASKVDCTIVVSEQERQLLLDESPELSVEVIPVISEIYGRQAEFHERNGLLFVGGYEHRPNVDAVVYFVREILPLIIRHIPEIRLHVVGSNPPEEITSLASEHVIVHGFVENLDDLMNSVRMSVNPLRFGAGVKGKIVTSMAHGVPCVGTRIAVEGMDVTDGQQALVADTPQAFADAVVKLDHDPALWKKLSDQSLTFIRERFSLETAEKAFVRIFEAISRFDKSESLELVQLSDFQAFQDKVALVAGKEIINTDSREKEETEPILSRGYCFTCDREADFTTTLAHGFNQPDGCIKPNWREQVVCPSCQLNNRMRASIHLFHLLCSPLADSCLYLTEQTTPLYNWFAERYPNLVGSEFLAGNLDKYPGIRDEDLTRLTFGDQSFDAILSFDVFEHIPDYLQAFHECLRCLKKDGNFFFSVPFNENARRNIVRAEIDANGEIKHLLPPEYHGNPLDPDGCLSFYSFGWELLDQLRQVGFSDVAAYRYQSDHFGYLGAPQFIFRAIK